MNANEARKIMESSTEDVSAVRENAKKPRGEWVTSLYYKAYGPTSGTISGLVMCKGDLTKDQERYKVFEHIKIIHNVHEEGVHAVGWESCRIKV